MQTPPDGLARSGGSKTWRMIQVLVSKHFFLSWKRKRWLAILYSAIVPCAVIVVIGRQAQGGNVPFDLAVIVVTYLLGTLQASMISTALIDIVVEKESKMKAVQEINGLPTSIYWASWLIYFMAYGALSTAISLAVLKAFTSFFVSSDLVLLSLLWLLSYAQLFTAMCCISVICSRAVVAGILGSLVQIAFTIPSVTLLAMALLQDRAPELWARITVLAVPLGGFMDAVASTMRLEKSGAGGLRVGTLMRAPHSACGPVAAAFGSLAAGAVVFALLAWWLDQVWQGEYGAARPFCFCCRLRRRGARRDVEPLLAAPPLMEAGASPVGPAPAISIHSMVKTFGRGGKAKNAVDGLSLDVFSGEVFALLGHNGSGKTTLLNCLVGLVPPTRGTARVAGFSVTERIDEVRRHMALCPQDNPLYAEFTVDRHLSFFAALRGARLEDDKTRAVLQALGLLEKRHSATSTLSGGQKRRLWVATALIADTPITVLDEPTSGMDPLARRELWAVLDERRREGRSVVFTTHYLDEADILADRKAILAHGQVKASGTSRELRRQFGVGYVMHVGLATPAGGEVGVLQALVRSRVPSAAEALIEVLPSLELVTLKFGLPLDEIEAFGPLFEELEARRSSLGVKDYGLQMTSLEEVFMRLGREEEESVEDSPQQSEERSSPSGEVEMSLGSAPSSSQRETSRAECVPSSTRNRSVARGVWAVVRLRMLCLARSRQQLFRQVVLPPLLTVLFVRTADSAISVVGYMPLVLSPLVLAFAEIVFKDIEHKCKFVSISQGLPNASYWLGTCIADYLVTLPAMVSLPVLISTHPTPFVEEEALPLIAAECLMFPLFFAPFAYFLAGWFKRLESIMKFVPLAMLIGCSLPAMGIFALVQAGGERAVFWSEVAHVALSLLNPLYGLPGTVAVASARPQHSVARYFKGLASVPFWCSPLCGALIWWRLLARDRRHGSAGAAPGGEAEAEVDEDVAAEAVRVRQWSCGGRGSEEAPGADAIACLDLRHTYPATTRRGRAVPAVRGVSLGARRGECFGLLGPNGAGKTTTLSLLSGEIGPPSSGAILVRGRRAVGGFGELLDGRFGMCPQVDPLWEGLSGRQHLNFFGRLKGVPESALRQTVDALLVELGLTGADGDKKVKEYSGGMKRKLSVGIALVGQPDILLLDEPTAAVDAAAKRHLWSLIRRRGPAQTVLLTTHSMEEAEALCDRLAIQVLGRLRCLGSPRHLRSGLGYRVEVFLRPSRDEAAAVESLSAFVRQRVSPEAALVECHRGRCLFQLPQLGVAQASAGTAASLAAVISELAAARQRLDVEEYSLWQPSLEQVFLCAGQGQEEEPATGQQQ